MSADPCQPMTEEVDQLRNDIADIQAALDRDFPPLTAKQRDEAKLQLQANEIKLLQMETNLLQCRQQNPSRPVLYLLAPDSPSVAVGDIVCVALSSPTPPGTPGTNVYKATTTGLANGAAPRGGVTAVSAANVTV